MNAKSVLREIEPLGSASYKRILLNHGAMEPCYGVKIDELKKILKRTGTNQRLALELYDTGVYDAMYLAGLMADDAQMSKEDLRKWVEAASEPLACSTVAWVAAGSPHGWELALEWIASGKERTAAAGWATLGSLVAVQEDAVLDVAELKRLLLQVQKTIHAAPNEARSKMNAFVIAVGSYVGALTEPAILVGEKIGPVSVDMGETACEVPFAPDHIRKVRKRGTIGKKRKTAKC